ncbi:hypothetical protein RRG08_027165 [Elysia crispata]|uniref:Uncharacterized protein n=1 Tax=Elysia crispata TaxID=231223 RepID=A0AAE1B4E0_9GAST|nr:hypothetical protein RRG08_027165 [Elysia crispata]
MYTWFVAVRIRSNCTSYKENHKNSPSYPEVNDNCTRQLLHSICLYKYPYSHAELSSNYPPLVKEKENDSIDKPIACTASATSAHVVLSRLVSTYSL